MGPILNGILIVYSYLITNATTDHIPYLARRIVSCSPKSIPWNSSRETTLAVLPTEFHFSAVAHTFIPNSK